MIELGKKYKDTVHGFTGIATAETRYLTGCSRVCLEYMDGKEIKVHTFDEIQLEAFEEQKASKEAPTTGQQTGGPRPGPTPR